MAESVLGWIRRIRRARLLPLLLGLMLLAALLAGCGANAASDPLLAAKVNGHGITLAQYQQLLALYRATNARNGLLTDWRSASERGNLASTQQQVLGILIDVELMREQLGQQHITVSQKAIQTARATLNGEIASLQKNNAQSSDPQLRTMLHALTPDVITFLAEQEAYQAAIQQKGKAPGVHLRGIETNDLKTAQELQQKAQSGSDFGELAKADSQNRATGALGGEIGTLYVGQISDEFDNAVFAPGAHPGKYLIQHIQNNYWLFELTDLGPHAISTINDQQTQASVVSAWLDKVVRPAASVEEYVTVG